MTQYKIVRDELYPYYCLEGIENVEWDGTIVLSEEQVAEYTRAALVWYRYQAMFATACAQQ